VFICPPYMSGVGTNHCTCLLYISGVCVHMSTIYVWRRYQSLYMSNVFAWREYIHFICLACVYARVVQFFYGSFRKRRNAWCVRQFWLERVFTNSQIRRVGQNRMYTPYMTVYLVISLPEIPYIHRVYMVLANPTNTMCV